MIYLYISIVCLLAAGVLWQWHDPSIRRASVFLFFVCAAALAGLDSLGAPKMLQTEFRKIGMVVAAEYDPGNYLYVWTRGDPPIAYWLPWSEKTAESLEKSLREARQRGEGGVLFAQVEYGKFVAHPLPQQEAPYKE